MELGRTIWQVIPRGLGSELRRHPWVLSSSARETLQAQFAFKNTDDLIISLARHVQTSTKVPSAAGFCTSSGKVYLAPSLALGSCYMDAVQVLLANIFVHGDTGLSSIASTEDLTYRTSNLVCEAANFAEMRLVKGQGVHVLVADAIPNEGAAGQAQSSAGSGDCFDHDGYSPLDTEIPDSVEQQRSLAKSAAARAYSPSFDEIFAGCALRTHCGRYFAGSAIGTFSRGIELSPLQLALVSMGARAGGKFENVHRLVWTAVTANSDVQDMCAADQRLLKEIAPSAEFITHDI